MIKYYMTGPVVRRAGYHPVGFNGGSRIPVDVRADHDAYTITAITPGLKAEDLKIEILGDVVTLRGEIRPAEGLDKADLLVNELAYGEFSRTLRLPETVNGPSKLVFPANAARMTHEKELPQAGQLFLCSTRDEGTRLRRFDFP
jgi:hypothetical protein